MKAYRNFDTNEIWTGEEVKELYDQLIELHDEYPTYEEYLEHMLDMGRQGTGGLVEEEIKMTIHGRPIAHDDMNDIASYMDDEIREALHSELAPCTHEEFIQAYLERDPEFIEILANEFDFEEA